MADSRCGFCGGEPECGLVLSPDVLVCGEACAQRWCARDTDGAHDRPELGEVLFSPEAAVAEARAIEMFRDSERGHLAQAYLERSLDDLRACRRCGHVRPRGISSPIPVVVYANKGREFP